MDCTPLRPITRRVLDVSDAAASLPDEADGPRPVDEAEDLSDPDESKPDDLEAQPEEAEA